MRSQRRLVKPQIDAPSGDFVSVWDTRLISSGSSASNQVRLPLHSSGDYNFIVDWGDGTNSVFTSFDENEIIHSYSIEGLYTITISGVIKGFSFYNSYDKLKFLEILSFGEMEWYSSNTESTNYFFYGCSNLTLENVSDIPKNIVSVNGIFRGCSSIVTVNRMNEWDVSQCTNFTTMLWQATNFNQDISNWDVSNVTHFYGAFLQCRYFNQPIGNWNLSSVVSLHQMFFGATNFNQDISSWNVSNATSLRQMFDGATKFNQDVSDWDVSNATSLFYFMYGVSNYNPAYLDNIYNKWSLLSVQPNLLNVHFGSNKYTAAGQSGKDILTSAPNNWEILDGGI